MATRDAIVGKDTDSSTVKMEAASNITKAVPGTIEVTARIMGKDGQWIGRTVQINSGVTVDTFDVSSRNGYLASFHNLEQSMIHARNEASREAAEAFLQEVGKKRMM